MNSIDVYRLSSMHRRLEDAIVAEVKKRIPDWSRILRLKKLRLAIKDRIAGHVRGGAFA